MDKKILTHFKKTDPLLYSTAIKIKVVRKLIKGNKEDYFLELCDAIVGQQLSGKAADTIFGRFKNIYKNGGVTPKAVLDTPHETLLRVGMSNSKAKYVKNLAGAVQDGKLDLKNIDKLSDEEVKKQLVQIKGIGPWTAEMFLMFTLVRPDIFSHGDLGLRKGIKKIYGFKKDPSIKTIERIIKKWSPYKTYASLVLWRSLEVI